VAPRFFDSFLVVFVCATTTARKKQMMATAAFLWIKIVDIERNGVGENESAE
jgi:hypothetical protein